MENPLIVQEDGIKIKPEIMEKERLYHCIFKNKLLLLFKDSQDFLNCYEIEEEEIVTKINNCTDYTEVEKILGNYVQNDQVKN